MDEKLKKQLLDIFEQEDLEESQVLREIETWDSLAALSIIALADTDYGFTLTAEELKNISTIGELAQYLTRHATRK